MHYSFGYFEEERLGLDNDLALWRRIISYIHLHWLKVSISIFLSLIITASSLALPYLIRLAVDNYIINTDQATPERLSGLTSLAILFIGLVVLDFSCNFLQVIILEWTGQNVMHHMRQQIFSHLLTLDLTYFNKNPVGKLVTRLTNDIQNMHEMFTSVIVTLFNDLIRIFGILIILFLMNWKLALIMCLLIPIMVTNTIWFSRLARLAFRDIRTYLARTNSFLQEALSGISIIQLFSRQQTSQDKFTTLNKTYLDKTIYQIKIFGIFMPIIEVLSSCAIALIIWYGGGQIIQKQISLGVLIAFLSYMRLFFQPLRELSQKYSIVQSAMASAERIFQLLDTKNTLPLITSPITPDKIEGRIEFKEVDFSYDQEQPVLINLNLTVNPFETLAIVGATGSGKSTLINLLERFYDLDHGAISLDGRDLQTLNLHWLRRNIGLVMQDVLIVPASIKENIVLDRELSNNRLQQIIDDAQLKELIGQLPLGWHTLIGEGGLELSAGEHQLLSLARVMARDPKILVLDEATSNVDTQTEMLIEKAIAATLANRTSIVIAHRLSTIRRADRIIVMGKGEILEQGNHDSLMAAGGLYYNLQTQENHGCPEKNTE
ncbi:MAG: ABC transporter ATP-binding protein/permease [Proteobacteria bacterium]|nr:ABC transporter ATP-binding protein/permease [Pseudomonadota bacterium]MBU1716559.1 ABC transporter ATP-binding protein/permease [Pseudomonadota bacterium]